MIKVTDIAFVRLTAPDLDKAQQFCDDFGLVTAERSDGALYSRGSDCSPWIHVVEKGEPGFGGVGFDAASADDLEAAAAMEGAGPIEDLDGPGGGKRVRFQDPDGFNVEIVHGREPREGLPTTRALPYNTGNEHRRVNVLQRLDPGPCRVKRLGHCVVRVSDFEKSSEWYQSRFGFIRSDEIYLGDENNIVTAFMRCDRGEIPVDHHTFLCVGLGEPGFDHAAFEVEDIDAVMLGNDHLKQTDWEHHAGIGRHLLGSQVFDYWKDPWGHVHEHFTDGDLLDAGVKTGKFDPAVALGTQWGKFGPA
ncbi:MAG: VOC family protein [Myxococcota bacterium]|nr:VOC family protein [Myxococcota bacterium]